MTKAVLEIAEPDEAMSLRASGTPDRTEIAARWVGERPDIVAADTRVLVPGQREVDALAVGTTGVFVAHASDDRIAVGLLREFGQQRADLARARATSIAGRYRERN